MEEIEDTSQQLEILGLGLDKQDEIISVHGSSVRDGANPQLA
jgi:hypothetical protein